VAAALCGVLAGVAPAVATTGPSLPVAAARDTAAPDTLVYHLNPLVVTATRTERTVFLTPAPVSYVSSAALREVQANTVGDVFRDLPGLDVTGVGAQQPRPIIRGQQGQRILLLQDALRLNNSRRQQDFGEIPALVDLSTVARIEVVRGPSSVLYGTDAIGGVVRVSSARLLSLPPIEVRSSVLNGKPRELAVMTPFFSYSPPA
jgi:hemoglobin/transferrin/lactoferrin receptor protein